MTIASKGSAIVLDDILAQLGAFGKYNIVNYALLLFPIYLAGIFGSIYVFEALDIGYRCSVPSCELTSKNYSVWSKYATPNSSDNTISQCERYVTLNDNCDEDSFMNVTEHCDTFVYDNADSIVKDFNLGCQSWKRTLVGSIHGAGLFIVLPLSGYTSDKYGRRVALSITSLMNGIFGLARSFAGNYETFILLEFLEPALGAGAYSTAFVLAMELVGPKGRVFGNTLINIVYVFGLMTLSALSWWLQDWRTLLRIVYTPALLIFSYLWLLNESVRWLLSKGRSDEAIQILEKAAKLNDVDLPEEHLTQLRAKSEHVDVEKHTVDGNVESIFRQVLKSSVLMKRIACCGYMWITCTFVYCGLSINSVSLYGNLYVNFALVGFIEIPANMAVVFLLDRFGRRKVLIVTFILGGLTCIGLSFLPKDLKTWSLVLFLIGKFCITISYSSVYIYVSEVFPTSVRQSLLAVCSTTGRVGSTMAPLTPLLAVYNENLPAILFGTMSIVSSMVVLLLPETINVTLPDTVEEAEALRPNMKRVTNDLK